MLYFGFFDKSIYKDSKESFNDFEKFKNELDKKKIIEYIRNLPVGAVSPMSITDMFTNDPIEHAGMYIDGDFSFPLEFLHYYEKYDIGIPKEYEEYIKTKI